MTDDEKRSRNRQRPKIPNDSDELVQGQENGSYQYNIHERMQRVYEKLTILGYQYDSIKLTKILPIHKFYFASQSNPGEQFHNFALLSAWLVRKCGRQMELHNELDDPNKTIGVILTTLKSLGSKLEPKSSKLLAGYGPEVISILEFFLEYIFKRCSFRFNRPTYPVEKTEDCDQDFNFDGSAQEISIEKCDLDSEFYPSSNDEDDYTTEYTKQIMQIDSRKNELQKPKESIHKMIEAENIDNEAWLFELECVTPLLRVEVPIYKIKDEKSDWMTRLEKMTEACSQVKETYKEMKSPIHDICIKLKEFKDRIHTRNRIINGYCEPLVVEYRGYEKILRGYKTAIEETEEVYTNLRSVYENYQKEVNLCEQQIETWHDLEEETYNIADVKQQIRILKSDKCKIITEASLLQHCITRYRMVEKNKAKYEVSKKFKDAQNGQPKLIIQIN